MRCYCCDREVALARKVKLRGVVEFPEHLQKQPPGPAYWAYLEEMTFRWAFICQGCYLAVDTPIGVGVVNGRTYNLAGSSRADKATTVDEAKYLAFRRKEAAKLGLDLPEEDEHSGGPGRGRQA
jgi:hypothetical protein